VVGLKREFRGKGLKVGVAVVNVDYGGGRVTADLDTS
jgi:hypothetical protein